MNRKIFFMIVLSILTMQVVVAETTSDNNPMQAKCLQTFGGGCTKFEQCTSEKCDTKETCTLENNNFVCENSNLKNKKKTIHPKSYLPKVLDNSITYQPVSVFQESTKRITPRSDVSFNQYHIPYDTNGNSSFVYGTTYPTYIQTSVFTSGNDLHSADRHNALRSYEKSRYNNLLDYKTSKVRSRLNAF